MEKFDSISHFLQSGGFEYRVFDMGRRLVAISNKDFDAIENQHKVYPYPLQKKAWLALLFWSKDDESEPVIWFLKFPIDEMGFLKQDARDGFLIGLLEQAGKNIQANLSVGNAEADGNPEDGLKESPFAFRPQEDRLALFHAIASKTLGRDPSRYYQATREYLLGNLGFDQWHFLGLQGIADVVANLDQDDNELVLAEALSLLPDVPLESFCRALENVSYEGLLSQALVLRLDQELADDDLDNCLLLSMLIRALAGSQVKKDRVSAFLKVLNSFAGKEIEVLVAISARSWCDLYHTEILNVFMANLAEQGQEAFNAVLTDLLMIPDVKSFLLEKLKTLQKTTDLESRLSKFLEGVKSSDTPTL